MPQFTVAGVDYRHLPLAALDRLASDPRTAATLVAGLDDAVALVTCNRIEVLTGQKIGPQPLLQRVMDATIANAATMSNARIRAGDDALRHLCRIASGLDALVVGEQIVTNQLRVALDDARTRGAQHTVGLLERVLTIARQAREAAHFDAIRREIGSDAGKWLLNRLERPGDHCVVVLGASGAAAEAAIVLKHGSVRVVLANRQPDKAADLAAQLGAENHSLTELSALLRNATAVIGASRSTTPPLTRDAVPSPYVVVDIAEPSDVDAGLYDTPGIKIVSAIDVSTKAKEAVKRAEVAIELALPALIHWASSIEADPKRRYHQWATELTTSELDRFLKAHPGLSDRRHDIATLLERVQQKLLHGPGTMLGRSDDAEALFLNLVGGSRRRNAAKERHNRRDDDDDRQNGKLGTR